KDGRNAMWDPKGQYSLSKLARHYIAGLLRHAPEFTAVTNQFVNSYKRLVPGYEAPVYLSWARRNRADLIRVPGYKPGQENATRVELRSPDPSCNPYLAFSVMLAAGLEGIENEYECPEPVEENVYLMSEDERTARGIATLPETLQDAVRIAEGSEFLKKALGDHVFNAFIANKKIEWREYSTQVTEFEINRYLPIL
ncbi:glutamine synthetase, partial [Candidatus Bipolaricaulota bacterium]|nr:glutamine synthetase [Candidatus Bipolaricaulota bacterium]